VKAVLKSIAFGLATIAVAPALVSYAIRSALLGRDRALQGSSQALSIVPGVFGQYLRRAFYCRVLDECHPSVTIEFGVLLSKAAVRLERNVYIGPRCDLGHVHLEHDVLLASGVFIPSGPDTHGTALLDRPIREQPGHLRTVRIGAGSWIGSAAIVMADVGRDSVVAAGAVVTEPVPDRVIAAGVPARVVRERVTGQVTA
jgi:virginiamycin A acetyltransferase